MIGSDLGHAVAIFGLTFVLEDVAVLGAALLVANNMVPLWWAAGSSFAGLWIGDLALYFLAFGFGRPLLDHPWFKKILGSVDLTRSESWFRSHGASAIVISRAIPGTRLPTYLAAGLARLPAFRFASITAAACLVWVAALFWLSYHVGMMVIDGFKMFRSEFGKVLAIIAVASLLGWLLHKLFRRAASHRWLANLRKLRYWEFWPMWLFYIPVVFKYLLLALRYRSLTLPMSANPGMDTGGLVGESKFTTLEELQLAQPEFVAETHLVTLAGGADSQLARLRQLRETHQFDFPFVLKPDIGQRGEGFKVMRRPADEDAYTQQFSFDFLLQRYAPGPHEIGVFYYRYPHESKGRIFAITEKVFPSVTGDGKQTLEQLIRADLRAGIIAEVYLERFATTKDRVPEPGETVRLVEAGNHMQGAIFLDGERLFSPELETAIDKISCSISGFYVGRYDIRYSSAESLRQGRDFQIIELNGISSEATSIYDPKHSVLHAYRVLFEQWEIVFAIADENRQRGTPSTSLNALWNAWQRYRRQAVQYTVSD